jgi:O-antigen/teichoic acid export membrane protein
MDIARGGIIWSLANFVVLGLSWLALAYFTRALAAPEVILGRYYLFETLVAFVALGAGGGVTQALNKRVSEGHDRGAFVGTGLVLVVGLLVVASVGVALATPLITGYFGTSAWLVLFAVLAIWGVRLRITVTSILEGFSRVGLSGGVELLGVFTKVVVQIGLVAAGYGLLGLVAGAAVGPIVAAVVAAVAVRVPLKRPTLTHARSLLTYGKYAFAREFTSKFYDNVDTVVIAVLLSEAAVGFYNVGFRFALVLTVVSGGIRVASFPEISSRAHDDQLDRVVEILEDGIVFSTLLAIPATAGIALLADRLIVTFYTAELAAAATVAVIAVAAKVPDGVRYVFDAGIDGLDRPEVTFRAGVLLIVTNAILDLLLVPRIGIEGAAVASLVGITLAMAYVGRVLLAELRLGMTDLPLAEVGAQVFAAVAMASVVAGLDRLLAFAVPVELTVLISAGTASYFAVLLVVSGSNRRRLAGIFRDLVPAALR